MFVSSNYTRNCWGMGRLFAAGLCRPSTCSAKRPIVPALAPQSTTQRSRNCQNRRSVLVMLAVPEIVPRTSKQERHRTWLAKHDVIIVTTNDAMKTLQSKQIVHTSSQRISKSAS
eukprot:6018499-Amphidinium_carterae.2